MNRKMRKIVKIDEDKCTGCGLCVPDCAEGAIQIIDGKARLVADNLCDGLGNCLGACPHDAITIEERPAEAFDPQAVEHFLKHQQGQTPPAATKCECSETPAQPATLPCGCPGTMMRKLSPAPSEAKQNCCDDGEERPSRLSQFPVQLALLPVTGSMWQGRQPAAGSGLRGFRHARLS